MEAHESRQKKVQAVERTLVIMEVLAKESTPMSLSEISYRANLNISTTHRLLNTLISKGFAEQDPSTGRYKLGLKTFEIGNAALYSLDIRSLGRPYLHELVKKYRETANLYIYNNGEVILIEQEESPSPVKLGLQVGSRLPAYCTSAGKIFLAYMSEFELKRVLKNFPLRKMAVGTIVDVEILRNELQNVRKYDFAEGRDEMEEGISCLAVPIRDHEGKIIAALSILGPTNRLNDSQVKENLIKGLKETGHLISSRLGYEAKKEISFENLNGKV